MSQQITTVLIVEDDFMVREMIKGRVQEAGYKVIGEAGDGKEAVLKVNSLRPDVVLMDIEMPETNGIEAARHIYNSCPTPVVMLTAYDTPELVEQAGQFISGAQHFVNDIDVGRHALPEPVGKPGQVFKFK